VTGPTLNAAFPHTWTAEILPNRPLILPSRQFVYPAYAEEIERGALEVLIRTPGEQPAQPFLATCALGFRDPAAPTGLWSVPHSDWLCALSGGYAYLINSLDPSQFTMLPYRPVLSVHPLPEHNLILFTGHHAILAWGRDGQAWQSERLSWEGVAIDRIEGGAIHGQGWDMLTDKDVPFTLDLASGRRL